MNTPPPASQSSTDTTTDASRFRMRWWMWLALVATLLLLGWLAWNLAMAARIDAELQAIRDAGYPVTPEELNDWYPEPEGENAADLYLEAFNHLRDPGPADRDILPIVGRAEHPDPTQPIPEDARAAMERYLEANKHALDYLGKAARIEGCRYPLDVSTGLESAWPRLGWLSESVRLLALQSRYRSHQNDLDGAVASLEIMLATTRSVSNEPLLVSYLIQMEGLAFFHNEVRNVVTVHDLTEGQLQKVASLVERGWSPRGLIRALAAERVMLHETMKTYGKRSNTGAFKQGPDSLSRAYAISGLIKRDQLLCLRILNDYIAAASAPMSDRMRLANDASHRVDSISSTLQVAPMVLAPLELAFKNAHRILNQRNVGRIALALLRYRAANSGFPDDLADLVPDYLDAVPVDTFTGRPIEYMQPTADSFILFTPEDRGPIPATDPKRLEFIRNLEDHQKFEYRVPEDHPTQPAPDDEDGQPPPEAGASGGEPR